MTITSADQFTNMGGFATGTLVHTQRGLRPIEEIRVGDWVLARSLDVYGDVEYKRVTHVEVREKTALNLFHYRSENFEGANAEQFGGIKEHDMLLVAYSHLVWSGASSWREIGELKKLLSNTFLFVLGENLATSGASAKLYISATPNVAWVAGYNIDHHGQFFDTKTQSYILDESTGYAKSDWFGNDLGRDRKRPLQKERFFATVYDLEVEDYQTVCVGKVGLWVAAAANGRLTQGLVAKPKKKLLVDQIELTVWPASNDDANSKCYQGVALDHSWLATTSITAPPWDSGKFIDELHCNKLDLKIVLDEKKQFVSIAVPIDDAAYARQIVLTLANQHCCYVAESVRSKVWCPDALVRGKNQSDAWRYLDQKLASKNIRYLRLPEVRQNIQSRLENLLRPLGFESIGKINIKEYGDFYFSRKRTVGNQIVYGDLGESCSSKTLRLKFMVNSEEVHNYSLNAFGPEFLLGHPFSGCHIPLLFTATGDARNPVSVYNFRVDNLNQIQHHFEKLDALLPRLVEQSTTMNGLDIVLNGETALHPDWHLIQLETKRENFSSLVINALSDNRKIDELEMEYRGIIQANPNSYSHRKDFNLEKLDILVRYLNGIKQV